MAADPRDVLTRSARPPDAVVRYGSDPEQFGEVWWPSAAAAPVEVRAERASKAADGDAVRARAPVEVRAERASKPADGDAVRAATLVLIIHGGFWQAEWDRMHARPMAAALADAGYVVGSVEYRRIGSPGGGGWPGTFDDVAAAIDELPEMITAVAPDPLHFQGVVLIGHSAGGHLALWAAARHRLPSGIAWHCADGSRIRGVVALAPVAALARADREGVGEGAVGQLVGGDHKEHPDRYSMVDPSGLAPSGVPIVVVHGAEDQQVPIGHSRSYVDDARASGDDIRLVELGGIEHFGLIDPLSPAWPAVLDAVRAVVSGPKDPASGGFSDSPPDVGS